MDQKQDPQVRTFTKWLNVQLAKAHKAGVTKPEQISDLSTDLRDGIQLLYLLSALSSDSSSIPKPEGRVGGEMMRIHKIINVDKALKWLNSHGFAMDNLSLGAEDIVDGNMKLTMGLIWMLIMRFRVSAIEKTAIIEQSSYSDSPSDSNGQLNTLERHRGSISSGAGDIKRTRAAILNWCKRILRYYHEAGLISPSVSDFSQSWRNGVAFLALCHLNDNSSVPEFSPYVHTNRETMEQELISENGGSVVTDDGSVEQWTENLSRAFKLAETHLSIPPLLEPQDVAVEQPDERIIITYLSEFYWAMKDLPLPPLATDPAAALRKEQQDARTKLQYARDELSRLSSRALKECGTLASWINAQQQQMVRMTWVLSSASRLEIAKDKLSPRSDGSARTADSDTFILQDVVDLMLDGSDAKMDLVETITWVLDEKMRQLEEIRLFFATVPEGTLDLRDSRFTHVVSMVNRITETRREVKVLTSEMLRLVNLSGDANVDDPTQEVESVVKDAISSTNELFDRLVSEAALEARTVIRDFTGFVGRWQNYLNGAEAELFGGNGGPVNFSELDDTIEDIRSQFSIYDAQNTEERDNPQWRLNRRATILHSLISDEIHQILANGIISASAPQKSTDRIVGLSRDSTVEGLKQFVHDIEKNRVGSVSSVHARIANLVFFLEAETFFSGKPVPTLELTSMDSSSGQNGNEALRSSQFSFLPAAVQQRAIRMAKHARSSVLGPLEEVYIPTLQGLKADTMKLLNDAIDWRQRYSKEDDENVVPIARANALEYIGALADVADFIRKGEERLNRIKRTAPNGNADGVREVQAWCSNTKETLAELFADDTLNKGWSEVISSLFTGFQTTKAMIPFVQVILLQGSASGEELSLPHEVVYSRANAFLKALQTYEEGSLAQSIAGHRLSAVAAWIGRADALWEEMVRVAKAVQMIPEEAIPPNADKSLCALPNVIIEDADDDIPFVEKTCKLYAQDVVSRWWEMSKQAVKPDGDSLADLDFEGGDEDADILVQPKAEKEVLPLSLTGPREARYALRIFEESMTREHRFRDLIYSAEKDSLRDLDRERKRLKNEVFGQFIQDAWDPFITDTEKVVGEIFDDPASQHSISQRVLELQRMVQNLEDGVENVRRRILREMDGVRMCAERAVDKLLEPTLLWLMRGQGIAEDIELMWPDVEKEVDSIGGVLSKMLSDSREITAEDVDKETPIETDVEDTHSRIEAFEFRVRNLLKKRVQTLKKELPGGKTVRKQSGNEDAAGASQEISKRVSSRIGVRITNTSAFKDAEEEFDQVVYSVFPPNFLKARLSLLTRHLQAVGQAYTSLARRFQDQVRANLDWISALQEYDKETRAVFRSLRAGATVIRDEIREKLPSGLQAVIPGVKSAGNVDDEENFDRALSDILQSLDGQVRKLEQEAMSEGWTTYRYYRLQEVRSGLLKILYVAANDGGIVRAVIDTEFGSGIEGYITSRGSLLDAEVSSFESRIAWALEEIRKSKRTWDEVGRKGTRILTGIRSTLDEVKKLDALLKSAAASPDVAIQITDEVAVNVQQLRTRQLTALVHGVPLTELENSEPLLRQARSRFLGVFTAGNLKSVNAVIRNMHQIAASELGQLAVTYVDNLELAIRSVVNAVEKLELKAIDQLLETWRKAQAEACEQKVVGIEIAIMRLVARDERPTASQFLACLLNKYEQCKSSADKIWKDIEKFEFWTRKIAQIVSDAPSGSDREASSSLAPSSRRSTFLFQPGKGKSDAERMNSPRRRSVAEDMGVDIGRGAQAEALKSRYQDLLKRYVAISENIDSRLAFVRNSMDFCDQIVQVEQSIKNIEKTSSYAAITLGSRALKDETSKENVNFEHLDAELQAVEAIIHTKLAARLDELLFGTEMQSEDHLDELELATNAPILSPAEMDNLSDILPVEFQQLIDQAARVRALLATTRQARSMLDVFLTQTQKVRSWVETRLVALKSISSEVANEMSDLLKTIQSSGEAPLDMVSIRDAAVRAAERSSALRNMEDALAQFAKSFEQIKLIAEKVIENHAGAPEVVSLVTRGEEELAMLWKHFMGSVAKVRQRLELRGRMLDWANRASERTQFGVVEALDKIESGDGWSSAIVNEIARGDERLQDSWSSVNVFEVLGGRVNEVIAGWADEVVINTEECEQLLSEAQDITNDVGNGDELPLMTALVKVHVASLRGSMSKLNSLFDDRKGRLAALVQSADLFKVQTSTCERIFTDAIGNLRHRLMINEPTADEVSGNDGLPTETYVLSGEDAKDKATLLQWIRQQVSTSLNVQTTHAQKLQEVRNIEEELSRLCDDESVAVGESGSSIFVIVKERSADVVNKLADMWKELSRLAAAEKDAIERTTRYHQWHTTVTRLETEISQMIEKLRESQFEDIVEEELLQYRERSVAIEGTLDLVGRAVVDSQKQSIVGGMLSARVESSNIAVYRARRDHIGQKLLELGHCLKEVEERSVDMHRRKTIEGELEKLESWCVDGISELGTRSSSLPPVELLNTAIATRTTGEKEENFFNVFREIIKHHASLELDFPQKLTSLSSLEMDSAAARFAVRLSTLKTHLQKLGELVDMESERMEFTRLLLSHYSASADAMTWIEASGQSVHQAEMNPDVDLNVKFLEERVIAFQGTIQSLVNLSDSIVREHGVKYAEIVSMHYISAIQVKTRHVQNAWDQLKTKVTTLKGSSSYRQRQVEFGRLADEIARMIEKASARFDATKGRIDDRGILSPTPVAGRNLFTPTPHPSKDPVQRHRELLVELERIILPRVNELKEMASRVAATDSEKVVNLKRHAEIMRQLNELANNIRTSREIFAKEAQTAALDELVEHVYNMEREFAKGVQAVLNSASSESAAWGIADAEAAALMLDGRLNFYDAEVRMTLSKLEALARSLNQLAKYRDAAAKWEGVRAWKDGVKEELLQRGKHRRAFIAVNVANGVTSRRTAPPHLHDGAMTSPSVGVSPRIYVPQRKYYTPNPLDQLDVEIARIVNECPLTIKVSPVRAGVLFPSVSKSSKSSGFVAQGKYVFGEALPKVCYCRLLANNAVVVRIGGGWQELSAFLLNHSTLEHRIPTVRSFVDYDPLDDPKDPARSLTTPIPTVIPVNPVSPTPSTSSSSSDISSDSRGSRIPVSKRTIMRATVVKVDPKEAINPYALTPRVATLLMKFGSTK